MVSQITGIPTICWTVYSGAHQRNIEALRHWPLWVESTGDWWFPLTNGPVTRKMFPYDDVIMFIITMEGIRLTNMSRFPTNQTARTYIPIPNRQNRIKTESNRSLPKSHYFSRFGVGFMSVWPTLILGLGWGIYNSYMYLCCLICSVHRYKEMVSNGKDTYTNIYFLYTAILS